MYEEIEAALDRYVRPTLRGHGGELEVTGFDRGVVRFKLKGRCAGCPAADLTTEELIQSALTEHVPGVTRAVMVQDVSEELLEQARSVIRARHGQQG